MAFVLIKSYGVVIIRLASMGKYDATSECQECKQGVRGVIGETFQKSHGSRRHEAKSFHRL